MRCLLTLLLLLPACAPVGQRGGGSGTPDQGVALDALPRPPEDGGGVRPIDLPDATPPPPDAAPPAPDAEVIEGRRLGVATFNVQRFFDMECDSNRCGETDFERQFDQRDFERKAEDIARALVVLREEHGADVVMLQEIEKIECLERVRFYLRQFDDPFPIMILGETNYAGSLDVAILARGDYVRTLTHRENAIYRPDGTSTRFSRELLEVHLDIDGQRIVAFAAHFKSKNGDDPGRRVAEARATREVVLDAAAGNPNALVVLGGDLNDTPGSDALNDLEGDGGLQRVAAELGDDAATYVYFEQRSALDHIYLAERASGAYVPGTARVVRSRSQDGLAGSDHAALRAQFVFPED